jgi:glycosyltransferase involved in cell wall biosynthesis
MCEPCERVDLLIPAYNEEEALPETLRQVSVWREGEAAERLARLGYVLGRVVVVDNASDDQTSDVARAGGAEVVWCGVRGYGSACLAGMEALRDNPPHALCFMDADGADDPRDLLTLLTPLRRGAALVIGSRVSLAEPGALTPVQRFGNALSCTLLKTGFGLEQTDLGPFRVISWSALEALNMADPNFGWTVEMQAKAARARLKVAEVSVRYRPRRAGVSKVSGQLKGSVLAGTKILWTIGKEWVGAQREGRGV